MSDTKGDLNMGTEAERQDTRKAVILDLLFILEEHPEQESFTLPELKKILKTYLSTADQK